ncbi:MAG: hypothetical protein R3253_09555 [Longimicrobiales bacterium]|nr:hypothetical protein [Longimicrobiales bacterium]
MMKTMRVALVVGMMTMIGVASAEAGEIHSPDDELTTQVLVMNNYLTDVRVYIEDAGGKLHHIARVARGSLVDFNVPSELAQREFRVKVYPAAMPGSLLADDKGVKTNLLNADRDQQVRVWLETDLPSSIVEIARD